MGSESPTLPTELLALKRIGYQGCITDITGKISVTHQHFFGKERIGVITVERFRDSIRLRWTINKKTYSLSIGKDSKEYIKAARAKAQQINSDILKLLNLISLKIKTLRAFKSA